MEIAGQKIHFLGIGGVGVSALAVMARRHGAIVDGCDRAAGQMTAMAAAVGIPVYGGHSPEHVRDADLLVYSSAVPADDPERLAAKRSEKRGAFLARLMSLSPAAVGVAGTHGKTTTTSLLARLLIESGRDPSVFVGGLVPGLEGRNHRLGAGPFVAELDESDGSFLLPALDVAVVTNVESEHLHFYGDAANVYAAFDTFADRVAAAGTLVAGVDDPGARRLWQRHSGRKIAFGFALDADLTVRDVRFTPGETTFRVVWRGDDLGPSRLPFPGPHNLQNALAAMAAALIMEVDTGQVVSLLAEAEGVGRRMERLGQLHGRALYSDYAHHPTEVRAAIAGVRQRHPGRILVVFQPHLYSRTRDYADAFGLALARADMVLVTDIYPAREEPIHGVDAGLVVKAAGRAGATVHGPFHLENIGTALERLLGDCEAVVMMGAGSIDAVARDLAGGGH